MTNHGALSGITILDLSRLLPGPYCSMILADHGARVIAVENSRFKNDAPFLAPFYRNKEHISLDLKTETGKEIFFKLLQKADILLEGFRPGATQRLGVDYERVKKVNPEIIYCSITGYGQTGPYRDRVGHDVNFLGIAGVLDLIGEKDRPPCIPGVQIADNILSHYYAFYSTYETSDKKYLTIGAIEYRFWKTLCETLNLPEYAPLQYDEERRLEIIAGLREKFKQKTLAQWEDELSDLDICWGPVNNLEQVLDDKHLAHREMVMNFEDQNGNRVPTLGVPVKLSETPGSLRTPPTNFAKNTRDILSELGYSTDEIDSFFDTKVV